MATTNELVIGFDLGGTKMMAAVLDGKNNVLGKCKARTKAESDAEAVFERIVQTIRDALLDANLPLDNVAGIGIGAPGPMDPAKGVVVDTPNMGFKNFPLMARLEKALGRPVRVDNDVNLGTYGEFCFGAAKGMRHVLGIFPGTGIGGGLILDGKLYRGANGAAGEIGHMIIAPDGPLCGCGRYGCVEAFASRLSLSKDAAVLAARGQAPDILDKAGTDVARIRSKVLARAIKAGDKEVERLVIRSAHYLGICMANAVNLLNPEAIVLGGGLVDALSDDYVNAAKSSMQQHAVAWMASEVKVLKAKLGDLAVVYGAAQLIRDGLATQANGKAQ